MSGSAAKRVEAMRSPCGPSLLATSVILGGQLRGQPASIDQRSKDRALMILRTRDIGNGRIGPLEDAALGRTQPRGRANRKHQDRIEDGRATRSSGVA